MSEKNYEILKDDFKFFGESKVFRIRHLKTGQLGGWIEKESNLPNEFVHPENPMMGAWVFNEAVVKNNAEISEKAQAFDHSIIEDNATIGNRAHIFDNAKLSQNSCVAWDAQIMQDAVISGKAKIFGYSKIFGQSIVTGNCMIFESSQVFGKSVIDGESIIRGNSVICDSDISESSYIFGSCKIRSGLIRGNKDFIEIGPIGMEYVTFFKNKEGGISSVFGCVNCRIEDFIKNIKDNKQSLVDYSDPQKIKMFQMAIDIAIEKLKN